MVSQILLKETLNPRFFLKIFILSTSKTAQRFDLSQFWASFWKKIEEIRRKSRFFSRTQTALTFDKNKWKYSLDIQLKGLPKGRLNPRFFLKIFILATSRAVKMKFSEVLGLHFGRKFQKIWIFFDSKCFTYGLQETNGSYHMFEPWYRRFYWRELWTRGLSKQFSFFQVLRLPKNSICPSFGLHFGRKLRKLVEIKEIKEISSWLASSEEEKKILCSWLRKVRFCHRCRLSAQKWL